MKVMVDETQLVEPIESIDLWLRESLMPMLEKGLAGQVADIDYGKRLAQLRRYLETKAAAPKAVFKSRPRHVEDDAESRSSSGAKKSNSK